MAAHYSHPLHIYAIVCYTRLINHITPPLASRVRYENRENIRYSRDGQFGATVFHNSLDIIGTTKSITFFGNYHFVRFIPSRLTTSVIIDYSYSPALYTDENDFNLTNEIIPRPNQSNNV